MDNILVAEDVVVSGPERPLLDGVSLLARPGELVAVTGSSGSGKTTLLSVLGGLLPPSAGSVRYAGRAVGTRSGEPTAGTAYVLQTYGLVPTLTAEENITVALRARGVRVPEAVPRSLEALQRLGVDDLAARLVQELSGGQLQRVAVARALALRPQILIADEPTAEQDKTSRELVLARLFEVPHRDGSLVLATHDPEVAERCDMVVVLRAQM
jgi:putative ABC transport system ATP-binding protein